LGDGLVFQRHLLIGAFSLLLSSCSYRVGIAISGSLNEGVTFTQRPYADSNHTKKLKVVSALVYELKTPPNEMWQIAGVATLDALKYASTPRGMRDVITAKTLEPGHYYAATIEVKCPGIFSPDTCSGEVFFTVLADGSVIEKYVPPQERE
jgi:hypothetical protein